VKIADMLKPKPAKNSCMASEYPYFCDYVLAYLKLDPSLDAVLGTGEAARIQAIYRGGLTIQTTMDPALMKIAREEITKRGSRSATTRRSARRARCRRQDRWGQGHRPEHRLQRQTLQAR
jgi:membrane peptidoglycan carboxypeptidase